MGSRSLLFVGGVELGPVPGLALCGPSPTGEVLLVHCDSLWRDLGCSGHSKLDEAKGKAEQIYPGISARWVISPYSEAETAAYIKEQWTGFECSVCGRLPPEFDELDTGPNGKRICNLCRPSREKAR